MRGYVRSLIEEKIKELFKLKEESKDFLELTKGAVEENKDTAMEL